MPSLYTILMPMPFNVYRDFIKHGLNEHTEVKVFVNWCIGVKFTSWEIFVDAANISNG